MRHHAAQQHHGEPVDQIGAADHRLPGGQTRGQHDPGHGRAEPRQGEQQQGQATHGNPNGAHRGLVLSQRVDVASKRQPLLREPGDPGQRQHREQRHGQDVEDRRVQHPAQRAAVIDPDHRAPAERGRGRGADAGHGDGHDQGGQAHHRHQPAIDEPNQQPQPERDRNGPAPAPACHDQGGRGHIGQRRDLHEAHVNMPGGDHPGQPQHHDGGDRERAQHGDQIGAVQEFRARPGDTDGQQKQHGQQPEIRDQPRQPACCGFIRIHLAGLSILPGRRPIRAGRRDSQARARSEKASTPSSRIKLTTPSL